MKRGQQGATTIEFALVLVLYLTFLLGITDFGRMLFTWSAASEATRAGARHLFSARLPHLPARRGRRAHDAGSGAGRPRRDAGRHGGAGHDVAQVRAVVQRAGAASRMDSARFRAEFASNPALQRVLYRYTDTLLAQAIQIAVCSRFHVLEARLARSLLVTRDRLQSDKFHLTHEFLAHALGVRRVGVTKAASALQQQGLIIYSRGNIEILDVDGLASASCKCYEIVKEAGEAALSTAFV